MLWAQGCGEEGRAVTDQGPLSTGAGEQPCGKGWESSDPQSSSPWGTWGEQEPGLRSWVGCGDASAICHTPSSAHASPRWSLLPRTLSTSRGCFCVGRRAPGQMPPDFLGSPTSGPLLVSSTRQVMLGDLCARSRQQPWLQFRA